jgi:hypothetical protein
MATNIMLPNYYQFYVSIIAVSLLALITGLSVALVAADYRIASRATVPVASIDLYINIAYHKIKSPVTKLYLAVVRYSMIVKPLGNTILYSTSVFSERLQCMIGILCHHLRSLFVFFVPSTPAGIITKHSTGFYTRCKFPNGLSVIITWYLLGCNYSPFAISRDQGCAAFSRAAFSYPNPARRYLHLFATNGARYRDSKLAPIIQSLVTPFDTTFHRTSHRGLMKFFDVKHLAAIRTSFFYHACNYTVKHWVLP